MSRIRLALQVSLIAVQAALDVMPCALPGLVHAANAHLLGQPQQHADSPPSSSDQTSRRSNTRVSRRL